MNPRLVVLAACVLGLVAASDAAFARSEKKGPVEPERRNLTVRSWLMLGPVSHPLPVFHDEKTGGFGPKALLEAEVLPRSRSWPAAGDRVGWFGGGQLTWTEVRTEPTGQIDLARAGSTSSVWLAAYLSTDRYRKLELRVSGMGPRRAWLDGEPVALGGTDEDPVKEEVKADVALTTGKHLLLTRAIRSTQAPESWSVGAMLTAPEDDPPIDGVSVSVDPVRNLDILDILDLPQITSVALSPDGRLVAASWSRIPPGSDEAETWLEIRAAADGRSIQTWRGGFGIAQVAWAPTGERLSYVTLDASSKDDKKTSTLWVADLVEGTTTPLVERVENLVAYRWSPQGTHLVYEATVKAESDKKGVKLHRNLLDRQKGWRDKTYLTLVACPGGARRRLSAGAETTSGASFSPDGRRLLFVREIEDLSQRPYSRKEIWEIDLETSEGRKLRDGWFVTAVQYAPDGRRILVQAGPSEFGAVGRDVPEGVLPNEADGQLYVWDPVTDGAEAITRRFDPSVAAAYWSRHDGRIYMKATDGDRETLWRYDPEAKAVTRLDTGVDVLQEVDFADAAPKAAVTGTSPWEPERLVVVDLEAGTWRTIAAPAAAEIDRVRAGTVKPFVFDASTGRSIDGRVYLPPEFDAGRSYPAIVYYYGGTSPVQRDWGGRYPKEWWASQGYIVYVLQPTGATGYGQTASAVHVNDWGEVTSNEIVEGTMAFLDAHPFVDRKRVGCIGASYGGFMTMLLTTKTDLFAAAVSHAGISQLSSYWGEGYWGYSYSALATADSFPWNRRDIYVDRSPLFLAGTSATPILLTHGAADTNVPVGESDAFYTAMKLRGIPAEFIEVDAQDHLILDHAKRIVWSRSIVAWFDRWLKNQPEWWQSLY